MKNKKATINPIKDYHNCFQIAVTVALIYEVTGTHQPRISTIKSFLNKSPIRKI